MKVGWSFLATLWLGCGGGQQGPIEPVVEEPPAKRAGTVSLANSTVYAIEVAYLNEVDASAPLFRMRFCRLGSNSPWC